jgi:hypothetical protein
MGLRACGAAVVVAAGMLCIVGGTAREHPVLGSDASASIGGLEARVAACPNDAQETRTLAQLYLDARQPGLAIVLVEGAPAEVRNDVRVRHAFARALIDEGHNGEALVVEELVVGTCHPLEDETASPIGCDAVLLASAMRRVDILRELLALGVEDARAQPEASLVAYQNATRGARVALE